jgi:hypothetical protein
LRRDAPAVQLTRRTNWLLAELLVDGLTDLDGADTAGVVY